MPIIRLPAKMIGFTLLCGCAIIVGSPTPQSYYTEPMLWSTETALRATMYVQGAAAQPTSDTAPTMLPTYSDGTSTISSGFRPGMPLHRPPSNFAIVQKVHAALAAAAFLVVFPLGGILIRVLNKPYMVWIHAGIQMFALALFGAAAGCGIWMSRGLNVTGRYHPIIGLVILGLMALQPMSEMLNHRFYQRFPKMIVLAHLHLWLGRLLITFGIINGGLGFVFADSLPGPKWDQKPRIAYGVVGTIVWIGYVAVTIVWQEVKMTKRKGVSGDIGEEMEGLTPISVTTEGLTNTDQDHSAGKSREDAETEQRREYRSSAL